MSLNPSPWRPIAASEIKPGDRVSVRGIDRTQSAIIDVGEVDETRTGGILTVTGFQPWGMGRRFIARSVHRSAVVELYVPLEVDR